MTDRTSSVPYPGILTTADGSGTVVWAETHITQAACAYPITSSTSMGQGYEIEVSNGRANIWGDSLRFLESESEHSAATSCEGFALAGGRVTNFTSGQGLILMKEVLYTISGKRLPIVFHIGARALTSHSLNVHAGHDDVMGVSDAGWAIVFGRNAQEAGDLALIARRAAEQSQTPFLNVQDGFLTTHTIESVLLSEPEFMAQFVGSPSERLKSYFDTTNPIQSGVVQNQDSYMKGKIAQRYFIDQVKPAIISAMEEFGRQTGRHYGLIDPYRMDDAEFAIVGMGGMIETAAATADWMRRERGWKVGTVHVTSYRPFPGPELVAALSRCRAVAVLERMDNPLAQDNPLASELKASFADALGGAPGYPATEHIPAIYSGSAGLGSRDVRPGDFVAVVEHMMAGAARRQFTLGIQHELAISSDTDPDVQPVGTYAMRGHSVGGFGSVTTNKIIASIVGDLFGLNVQAYPLYGSEKKGLPTTYYLAIADEPIRTHCELKSVDFLPLNDANAFNQGNPLNGLREGGMVFMQSQETDPELVWQSVPSYAQKVIREKHIRLLALDTIKIAREVSSRAELEQRMQGIVLLGVFLKNAPIVERRALSYDEVIYGVEKSLRKYFGKQGDRVIQDNMNAVQRGYNEVFEIPREVIEKIGARELVGVGVKVGSRISLPMMNAGGDLAVVNQSAYVEEFNDLVMGAYGAGVGSDALPADIGVARSLVPAGTGAMRDFSYIAPDIPLYNPDNCVGCMSCVTECPDTAILGKAIPESRLNEQIEALGAQEDSGLKERMGRHWATTKKYYDVPQKAGKEGAKFGIFVDPMKCKGCQECVKVCDDLGYHALKMIRKTHDTIPQYNADFTFYKQVGPTPDAYINERSLVDMMLKEDDALLYVGGAGSCMGCGEATALRMMLAATGFAHGKENIGIVASTGCNTVYGSTYPYNPYLIPWTNSLFENGPADAMGIRMRWDQIGWEDKKLWVIGGDGAMYDIGFQSLSRMLASGMDIKVLVLDTQVYSNTGGQASTSTFTGQDAKMATFGKARPGKKELRKELSRIAIMHPHTFVAQTSAAYANHFYKSVMRANEFKGPALVNVYTTCQPEHGVGDNMSSTQAKLVVESRGFPLFIYDPDAGETIAQRMSLTGNPAVKEDWYTPPKAEKPYTFVDFARTEGRFRKQFAVDGTPSETLKAAEEDRLANWHILQELAGLR